MKLANKKAEEENLQGKALKWALIIIVLIILSIALYKLFKYLGVG
jgi:flagellar basal body-associated protein FliL